MLLGQSGNIKSELSRGEHKSLQADRVILVPGTDMEVDTVNQILARPMALSTSKALKRRVEQGQMKQALSPLPKEFFVLNSYRP